MAGVLEKSKTLISYDPGYPPTPAQPGYWREQGGGRVCQSVTRSPSGEIITDVDAYLKKFTGSLKPGEIALALITKHECYEAPSKKVWVPGRPAQPGEPPTIEWDMHPGWNAGALSIAGAVPVISAQGWLDNDSISIPTFTFTVSPDSIGVVIGLTRETHPTRPEHIIVGVRVESGMAKPVLAPGLTWDAEGPPWNGQEAVTKTDKFTIKIATDGVWVFAQDFGGWGFVPMPVAESLHLGAALYLGGDRVLSAGYSPANGVQYGASLAVVTGEAGSSEFSWHVADIAAVVGVGGEFVRSVAELPGVVGCGVLAAPGAAYGFSDLWPVTSEGTMNDAGDAPEKIPAYQVGAELAGVIGVGMMRSGWNARQDESGGLPQVQSLGGEGVMPGVQDSGQMPALEAFAFADPPDTPAYIGSAALARGSVGPAAFIAVVVTSRGALRAVMDVHPLAQATLNSQSTAASDWQLDAQLLAFIDSVVRGATLAGGVAGPAEGAGTDFDAGDQVWVLNTRTGAMSRYQNYSFNSFAQIGGHYFGADEGGIYLLEGEQDGDAAIPTRIATGQMDLGSKQLKHVSNVYLGVASDGVVNVTVQANGQEYTYQARRSDAYSQQQRVDTGKGLRSTLYSFELVNTQALELDSMEINVAQSGRRI